MKNIEREYVIGLVLFAIVVVLVLTTFVQMISSGIEKHERIECIQWLADSQNYDNWYATEWQVEQCENYGVDLQDYLVRR